MNSGRASARRLFALAWSVFSIGLFPADPVVPVIRLLPTAGTAAYAQDAGGGESSDALPGDTEAPPKPEIDPADKMYAEAHMKIVRRNFRLGNIDKAKEELDLVIERVGSHAEARFMRAVIAAKSKDFLTAWRHISVAEQSAPDHPRVKEFVARLEKAMPRPSVIPDEVTARPAPAHASELLGDALEALFANKAASAKISAIACREIAESDGKVVAKLTFEGKTPLDENPIKDALKETLKGEIVNAQTASGGTILDLSVEIPGQPLVNAAAKPVSSLGELLKTASEETDVPLKNSSESEPDADKRVTGTYTIVAAGLKNVNDFMRKLSPDAVDFHIVRLESTTMNEQNVWKGEVSFRFLAP